MSFPRLAKNHFSILICLALALATFALYAPMLRDDFVILDDEVYITGNPHVTSGLTRPNVIWAFEGVRSGNWHPLTWISHMADCQMFGLNPGGHHLVNLLFHIATTLLLFVWLNNLTGARWRSAFVAALFAWHPMHVESVAWASERKDVLSAFFWMLALLAYGSYAQKKSPVQPQFSPWRYFLALFFFACGLMSKPMVVTLPLVLLLLDFWPLRRFSLEEVGKLRRAVILIFEKIPFFLLALGGSIVTFMVQRQGGAIWPASLGTRLENIVLAYVRYVSKLLWPHDLAVVYPFPSHWPVLPAIGAALLLLTWTALVIFRARQNPYLITGWFWFLGTLVPTIGIVQIGAQSMADRYAYIPSIGLFILVAWGANDLLERWPEKRKFLPVVAGLVLVGCMGATSIQLGYWRNSTALFLHAIEVTTDNYMAENCLGRAFEKSGDKARALVCYRNSVEIEPRYPQAQFNLAACLMSFGKNNEALEYLRAAAIESNNPGIQYSLGIYFLELGNFAEAATAFRTALANQPDFPEAKEVLGKLVALHPELR